MKLLFVCPSAIAFHVMTPEHEALGGTESSAAYLARALARNRHDVTLAARLPPGTPGRLAEVRHVPLALVDDPQFFAREDFDAVIALSAPVAAAYLRKAAPNAFQVAWLHLLADQSAMAPLAAMAPWVDCAVFVSRTYREMTRYGGAAQVIGNGFAPAFAEMFASAEELRAAKRNRAVYTSMPYRGLALLAEVIGRLHAETEFEIYSAMRTYRMPEGDFAALYEKLRNAPRTHYHGAVSQAVLAERMKSAAFLAYPTNFVESYCISALEAMAAGLKVVSIDLGALRETTLGFADLLTLTPGMDWPDVIAPYTALLEKNAADFRAQTAAWAARMFEQVQTVNRLCSWSARATQWEQFLGPAIAAKRASR